ncbi:MAG: HD domain-containing protein [Lachnospiraceae bacterium]|nr:HD domain-containing protein [Lachnospiraceae bacterium]
MKEQIDRLLQHPIYRARLECLQELEQDRIYCGHNLEHFMAVGRIAEQVAAANRLLLSKEVIWGAALLHDMGRVEQYQQGISHEKASEAFAREILFSLNWEASDIDVVCEAVSSHGHRQCAQDRWERMSELVSLTEVISFADQFSRKCYQCTVADTCKWTEEEKIKRVYFKE